MEMASLFTGLVLTGLIWAAFRIAIGDVTDMAGGDTARRASVKNAKATARAMKAVGAKRLSNESLSNIIRLECNRGEEP